MRSIPAGRRTISIVSNQSNSVSGFEYNRSRLGAPLRLPLSITMRLPCFIYCVLLLSIGLVAVAMCSLAMVYGPAASRHLQTTSTDKLLKALDERNKRFKVVAEEVVYGRYARVYDRKIQFPNGKTFSFDIWGRVWRNNSFSVVSVVPFDRYSQTFTLVREYNPAHERHVYSFPQGMVEWSKHTNVQAAAAAELEEEAHLKCRKWTSLLTEKGAGVPQDKYQREVVFFYLCADVVTVDKAAKIDEEEDIEIVNGVTIRQFQELCAAGVLQSNNVAAGLMAIEQLRAMRFISKWS